MNNRDQGLEAIKYWYRASGFQLRGITFDQAVQFFDGRNAGFIKALGGGVKDGELSAGKLQTAMEELASRGWQKYPSNQSFFDALIEQVNSFSFEDVKEVVSKTVQDVKTTAVAGVGIGIGVYAAVLAVGALIMLSGVFGRARQ